MESSWEIPPESFHATQTPSCSLFPRGDLQTFRIFRWAKFEVEGLSCSFVSQHDLKNQWYLDIRIKVEWVSKEPGITWDPRKEGRFLHFFKESQIFSDEKRILSTFLHSNFRTNKEQMDPSLCPADLQSFQKESELWTSPCFVCLLWGFLSRTDCRMSSTTHCTNTSKALHGNRPGKLNSSLVYFLPLNSSISWWCLECGQCISRDVHFTCKNQYIHYIIIYVYNMYTCFFLNIDICIGRHA